MTIIEAQGAYILINGVIVALAPSDAAAKAFVARLQVLHEIRIGVAEIERERLRSEQQKAIVLDTVTVPTPAWKRLVALADQTKA